MTECVRKVIEDSEIGPMETSFREDFCEIVRACLERAGLSCILAIVVEVALRSQIGCLE